MKVKKNLFHYFRKFFVQVVVDYADTVSAEIVIDYTDKMLA